MDLGFASREAAARMLAQEVYLFILFVVAICIYSIVRKATRPPGQANPLIGGIPKYVVIAGCLTALLLLTITPNHESQFFFEAASASLIGFVLFAIAEITSIVNFVVEKIQKREVSASGRFVSSSMAAAFISQLILLEIILSAIRLPYGEMHDLVLRTNLFLLMPVVLITSALTIVMGILMYKKERELGRSRAIFAAILMTYVVFAGASDLFLHIKFILIPERQADIQIEQNTERANTMINAMQAQDHADCVAKGGSAADIASCEQNMFNRQFVQ